MTKDFNFFTKNYIIEENWQIYSKLMKWYLKPSTNNWYKQVVLCNWWLKQNFTIHELVARKFHWDTYKSTLEVNHKDWNKLNNNKDNLERVTKSENILHSFKMWRDISYLSNLLSKPVIALKLDDDWNILEKLEFSSQKQWELKTWAKCSNITRCCQWHTYQSNGYQWHFYNWFTEDKIRIKPKPKNPWPYIRKTEDKNILCLNNNIVYKNIHNAWRLLNIDPSSITKVCRWKRKSAWWYKFKYCWQ